MFADISNIENTNNYLPLLNGCINAELTMVFLCVYGFFVSSKLRNWYKTFQLTALIFDISALLLVIVGARYLYRFIFKKFNMFYFLIMVIMIQLVYSLLLYFLVNHYWLRNDIFNFQKKYINEIGLGWFLFYSTFIIIIACLLSSYYSVTSLNSNVINLIISVFFYSFMINEI